MSHILAVVGSRNPNAAQRERCQQAVVAALEAGWHIVTGGAPGVDHLAVLAAQRAGHAERVTLVLPWRGFEGWQDQRLRYMVYDPDVHTDWLGLAKRHHPNPGGVKSSAWPLLARNAAIIRMAEAVFAYPSLAKGTYRGGTAHDIRLAQALGRKLWVDDGRLPAGTPFREALRRIRAGVPAAAAGA